MRDVPNNPRVAAAFESSSQQEQHNINKLNCIMRINLRLPGNHSGEPINEPYAHTQQRASANIFSRAIVLAAAMFMMAICCLPLPLSGTIKRRSENCAIAIRYRCSGRAAPHRRTIIIIFDRKIRKRAQYGLRGGWNCLHAALQLPFRCGIHPPGAGNEYCFACMYV